MIKLKRLILESINIEEKVQEYLLLNNKLQIKLEQLLKLIKQVKEQYHNYYDTKKTSSNDPFIKYQKSIINGEQRLGDGKDWAEHLVSNDNHGNVNSNQLQTLNVLIKFLKDLTTATQSFSLQAKKIQTKIKQKIKQQSVEDIFNGVWNILNNLTSKFNIFIKTVSNLPKNSN